MSRQRVLVVGWKKPLLDKARALDTEIWFVQHPDLYDAETAAVADVTLALDYTDQAALVALVSDLHAVRPFDAVVGIAEDALLPVAAVNTRLGLRGPSFSCVRLLTDKRAMRQRLAERGVGPVACSTAASAEEVVAFGSAQGYPFIAKPIAGCGSFGIHLVQNEEQARQTAAMFRKTGSPVFLLEEFLDGHEISVESFSFHGRHVVLALTDKLVGENFVEAGHAVPASVDATLRDQVTTLVGDFLDAVGLTDGPSHVEVKLTACGPRIVEGHNRRGGDRINELVELACGVDMETLTLAWALDRTEPLTGSPLADRGAAVRFLTAAEGRVRAITGVEEARAETYVEMVRLNVAVGQLVGSVGWSDDRPGLVIATAATGALAAAESARWAQRIVIHTENAPAPVAAAASPRPLDQARLLGYGTPDADTPTD